MAVLRVSYQHVRKVGSISEIQSCRETKVSVTPGAPGAEEKHLKVNVFLPLRRSRRVSRAAQRGGEEETGGEELVRGSRQNINVFLPVVGVTR